MRLTRQIPIGNDQTLQLSLRKLHSVYKTISYSAPLPFILSREYGNEWCAHKDIPNHSNESILHKRGEGKRPNSHVYMPPTKQIETKRKIQNTKAIGPV